jgi:glutamate/tyrosine decarboxylase-like PLP-dependent enzyme/RimJ/RimL family protein N-acetyltransferase
VDTVIDSRVRPDGRCVVRPDGTWTPERAEAATELARSRAVTAVATIDADAMGERATLEAAGFTVTRREVLIELAVEAALEALRDAGLPSGLEIRSAADVNADRLRLLDDELRADVPGTAGWRWDADGFHAETFESGGFDPRTYLVAVDSANDEYVGIVRIWMNPERPRLGFAGVRRTERRRGIAAALLARALDAVRDADVPVLVAEHDVENTASSALARKLGAQPTGETLELEYRPPQHAQEVLQLAAHYGMQFHDTLSTRAVYARASFEELTAALGGELPEQGAEDDHVLTELVAAAEPGLIGSQTGRYYGFVFGSALPVAVAADWVATAWDQNAFSVVSSPAAAAAEHVAAGWIAELLGLPSDVSSGFVTGAQGANTTALAAARGHVLAAAGWDVEVAGLAGAPRIRVLAGTERHVTIDRSLRLLGLGTASTELVPVDAQGRLRADALAQALGRGEGPAIVCAQAGNVNTGAFDPLPEITAAAADAGAWVHVDGAFGLWAAASPRFRHLVDGVERADSWATDAHKWLNVPYDCGLVFTRHPEAHGRAMAVAASYLQRSDGRSPADWVPESSRRARGFAVWAALRSLGRSGVEELVDRCCDHARAFAEILGAETDVAILNDVVLNQVLVRFGDDDETTQEVVRRVQADGTCWLGGTVWQGKAAMRISVSSFRTTPEDVERSAGAILAAATAVLAGSRSLT